MTDKITAERRSANMARIRSKNTKPELQLRQILHRLGYRFRLHSKHLPGKPDVVFQRRKAVIFLHGCFWHQHPDPTCLDARPPKSRLDYWRPKLEGNVQRDWRRQNELEAAGWRVLVVWDCELNEAQTLNQRLTTFLGPTRI